MTSARSKPRRSASRPVRHAAAAASRCSPRRASAATRPWLWVARPGFEEHLAQEILHLLPAEEPRVLGPGWVQSKRRPAAAPVFARQVLPMAWVGPPPTEPRGWDAVLAAAAPPLARAGSWTAHGFATDSNEGRAEWSRAEVLAAELAARLRASGDVLQAGWVEPELAASVGVDTLVQLALVAPTRMVCGAGNASEALSLAPGGLRRLRAARSSPSRAASKLQEALEWVGLDVAPGDLVVDFGAAPGGWTWVALERRARVIAVDPGRLRPDLMAHRSLRYVCKSAFHFEPPEPADWLLCDMAWRPMEVAGLLAKWGRQKWARMLVANFKLPMRQKVEFVYRILGTLRQGGWKNARGKQLYHDRNEITVFAHR